jgi:hypothetical protein
VQLNRARLFSEQQKKRGNAGREQGDLCWPERCSGPRDARRLEVNLKDADKKSALWQVRVRPHSTFADVALWQEGVPMRRSVVFLLQVVLPIAVGASIYVGWRTTDLLVFRWIDAVGASELVFRPAVPLPGWVLCSLPDGCWVYAYTSWMLMIWGRITPWVLSGVILAVGAEFGQLLGLVPGTYDNLDVAFYVGACILAGVIHAQTHMVNRRSGRDGFPGVRQRKQ